MSNRTSSAPKIAAQGFIWPWSVALQYITSQSPTISWRHFEAISILSQTQHKRLFPTIDIVDVDARVKQIFQTRLLDPQKRDQLGTLFLKHCQDTLSALAVCKCEIDPVIQVGGFEQGPFSKLKSFDSDGQPVCRLESLERSEDIWDAFVQVQIKTLKKMNHSGFQVYQKYYYDNGPVHENTKISYYDVSSHRLSPSIDREDMTLVGNVVEVSAQEFVDELCGLLEPDNHEMFEDKFGFPQCHENTMKMLSILKVKGEAVIFCSENLVLIILQTDHLNGMMFNGSRVKDVENRLIKVGDVVLFRSFRKWTVIAYIYMATILICTTLVALYNPAKRDNWFEISTDCITVLATSLATGVTFFGLRGDLINDFNAALRGCSRWTDEADIKRDLSNYDLDINMILSALTTSSSAKLRGIWKTGSECFSIDRFTGCVPMTEGLSYDPQKNISALIVGQRMAFNMKTMQNYIVRQKFPSVFEIEMISKPADFVIMGIQKKVFIA